MDPVKRVAALIAAAALAALSFIPAAQAAPAELTSAGQEGLEQIATCLRSNPNLVALLVIDESGSLKNTDPGDQRAGILADFVLSLASLAGQQTPQGPRTVEFAANTFALESQRLVPWTTLSPDNAQDIASRLRAEVPALKEGEGTNYESAVKGARGSVAEGVSRIDSALPPCKIVVWFTDGVLSVSQDPSVNEESAQRLCAPDGPINALRKEQIHLVSVLLFDRATLGDFEASAQETLKSGIGLLQATAEGAGGSGRHQKTCGEVPVPDDFAKGAFLEGNLDALAGQFGQAIAIGSGGTRVSGIVGSPVGFEIEPGFTSFWVTALAPDGFTLDAPLGTSLAGSPGSSGGSIAGTQAEVTWSGATFTAKIPVTDEGLGQWTITRPGMTDAVGVYLFSDYRISVNPVELVAGEEATITGSVTTADGRPADLSTFSIANLAVTQIVDGQEVEPVAFGLNRDEGTFSGSFTPETTSTEVRFDLTLDLATQKGFALAPLTTGFVQQVKLPGAYPQITPALLDLGALQNRGDGAEGTIRVQGSLDGDTQVCVAGITTESDLPDAQVGLTSTPASGCIPVPQGGSANIDLKAVLGSGVADGGQVSGYIDLLVTNAATEELPETRERPVQVPFTVQVVPVGPVLWVPFVLTAVGVVLPLLFLWLVNWRAARLRLDGIMMARVPVEVALETGGVPRRRDGKPGNLLTYEDLAFTPAPARAKSWSPGPENLRARTPLNPFGSVKAQVSAPASHAVVSNQPPNSTKSGAVAGLGLCPSMTAYVLVPREGLNATNPGDTVEAELVAFLIPINLQQDAQHLSTDITSFGAWGELLSEIKAQGVGASPVEQSLESTLGDTSGTKSTGDSRDRFDQWTPPPSTRDNPSSAKPPGDAPPPSSGNRFTL